MIYIHIIIQVILLSIIAVLLYDRYRKIKTIKLCKQTDRTFEGLMFVMDLAEQGWAISSKTDAGWKIEKASKIFCDILGYGWESDEKNEVVGMCRTTLVAADTDSDVKKVYLKDQTISIYITKLHRKDGKYIWCEISAQTVMFHDTGKTRISVIKNVEHIINRFKK